MQNRLLSNNLHTLLTPNPPASPLLADVLRRVRTALFPNLALAQPPRPVPSVDEQDAIKARCRGVMGAVVPGPVRSRLFGNAGDGEDGINKLLELLGDSYCNKHLMYAIVERVLVRLMPELGVEAPGDLMRARVGERVD